MREISTQWGEIYSEIVILEFLEDMNVRLR